MAFKNLVRRQELSYINKIMAVFGVVEAEQMRLLFSHMKDLYYNPLIAEMIRGGLIYCSPDSKYLASSSIIYQRMNFEQHVRCFWIFIKIKDLITEFCQGEYPCYVSVNTGEKTCDLLPLTDNNAQQINDYADVIPENTVRYLFCDSKDKLTGVEPRIKNDYLLIVDQKGKVEAYKL